MCNQPNTPCCCCGDYGYSQASTCAVGWTLTSGNRYPAWSLPKFSFLLTFSTAADNSKSDASIRCLLLPIRAANRIASAMGTHTALWLRRSAPRSPHALVTCKRDCGYKDMRPRSQPCQRRAPSLRVSFKNGVYLATPPTQYE